MRKLTLALACGTAGLVLGLFLSSLSAAGSRYADDRAQIEDLQARYLFALDFHDSKLYVSTFTPDGIGGFGHYEDELVKVNGQWFFTKRKIYNEGSAEWAYTGPNPAW
jgi:hypothetical protein